MRMSLICSEYYNIKLNNNQMLCIDSYFIGAAHHRCCFLLADQGGQKDVAAFHLGLLINHLMGLLHSIHGGDFSKAQDPTGRGLEDRRKWNPDNLVVSEVPKDMHILNFIESLLPDPTIFCGFDAPDCRWGLHENHPFDEVIYRPSLAPILSVQLAHDVSVA